MLGFEAVPADPLFTALCLLAEALVLLGQLPFAIDRACWFLAMLASAIVAPAPALAAKRATQAICSR